MKIAKVSSHPGIVVAFCHAWAEQDLAGALRLIHPEIEWSMFIPEDVVPFGGMTQGKAAMSDRMKTIIEQFETLRFEPVFARRDGTPELEGSDYVRVAYAFRHRLTGESVAGHMRLLTRMRDNLIIEIMEYHDLEKVRAFMRLISYRARGE